MGKRDIDKQRPIKIITWTDTFIVCKENWQLYCLAVKIFNGDRGWNGDNDKGGDGGGTRAGSGGEGGIVLSSIWQWYAEVLHPGGAAIFAILYLQYCMVKSDNGEVNEGILFLFPGQEVI